MKKPKRECRRRGRGHRERSLAKRLFLWFVLAIVAAGAAGAMVMSASGGRHWADNVRRIERFTARQFARVWHDPAARDALADDIERELGVQLTLVDRGRVVRRGGRCDHRFRHRFRVPGVRGRIRACMPPPHRPHGRFLLALGAALVVLMALAGVLARRLGRPLRTVADVARRLGEGDLSARVERDYGGEVGALSRAMNEMAARIERQLAEQRELLAVVSHEMRTPLGHVRLLLELAREGDPSAIEELEREVAEMDDLVGELLVRSRLDFEDVSERPLDATELARRALERRGLDAALLEAAEDAPTLQGDATLLARALANLLENADRHGGGVRALRVGSDAEGVVFEVADHGEGFDLEQVAPFQRGDEDDPADETAPGLGLGLSLVRRIAEAHGGMLEVAAEPEGAVVRLRIPIQ